MKHKKVDVYTISISKNKQKANVDGDYKHNTTKKYDYSRYY